MSTSEKQIEANRQKAQNSTGPRSEEGKKTSSQNAVKHALFAQNVVVNSPHLKEDQAEYDLLLQSFYDELKPVGIFQEQLVRKIANIWWRYRRLINAETAAIAKQLTPKPSFEPASEVGQYFRQFEIANQDENWFNSRSIPVGDSSVNFARYEWRLSLELNRAYKMLNQLKYYSALKPPTPPIDTFKNEPNSPPFLTENAQ